MKDDVAIKIHDLHKSFDLAENKSTSFKQLLVNAGKKNKKKRQKVLDGIDFEIKKGEFFGIVGRNGSGKSTLLKLLAGVYTPDSGAVEVNGELTPFIELGVGFNPELSGRDNVYLSASLLGFTRQQVNEIYDEIVDFAELHEHMDKKLKNYSSGMQVRLAFSIAVKAKNDILIFDEVLAVGDEAFQKKCFGIFEEYRDNKQTVILVTHNMDSVRSFCSRALMLDNGKIKHIGSVERVADEYTRINTSEVERVVFTESLKNDPDFAISGYKPIYQQHETMKLDISWPKIDDAKKVSVAILGANGENIFDSNSGVMNLNEKSVRYGVKLSLGPGRYFLSAALFDDSGKILKIHEKFHDFLVEEEYDGRVGGFARLEYKYSKS